MALVLLLAAGACSGGGSTPAAPAVDTPASADAEAPPRTIEVPGARFIYTEEPGPGVASRATQLDGGLGDFEEVERVERDVPLAMALRACRLDSTGQFTFDVQWLPPDGVDLPVTVTLWVGPSSNRGVPFTGVFEVELAEPGLFRLAPDVDPLWFGGDVDDRSFGATSGDDPLGVIGECRMVVLSEVYIDDQSDLVVTFESARDAVPVVDAPDGSFQLLAGTELPVAGIVRRALLAPGADLDLLPDHVWLAPEAEIASLVFSRIDTCWSIRSTWVEPAVTVVQSQGCESGRASSQYRVVEIEDPAWRVTVTGVPEAVEAFALQAPSFPVAGVDPA